MTSMIIQKTCLNCRKYWKGRPGEGRKTKQNEALIMTWNLEDYIFFLKSISQLALDMEEMWHVLWHTKVCIKGLCNIKLL